MSLLSLIQEASASMATKMSSITDAASGVYDASPLGKIEEGFDSLEYKFNNSPLHQSFAGGDYGSGKHGASNFGQSGMSSNADGYVDATNQLQSVMQQGGILNPAVSQLQSGGPAAVTNAALLSGYDIPVVTTPVNPYDGKADELNDSPEDVATMEAAIAEANAPVLLQDEEDKTNALLAE